MTRNFTKRKPFVAKTPREQVSIFKYQLCPDGVYRKVYLSDEEALALFGGQGSEPTDVVNKCFQTSELQ